MRSAVIIPVFNESERIIPVVEASLANTEVDEVVVVNDGSTDNFFEVLDDIAGDITVLNHPSNLGKGEALDTGMAHVRNGMFDSAIFLDGDLVGITPSHISELLAPLEQQDAVMTIGYLGLRKTVVKRAILSKWGALSGQRALDVNVWDLLNNQDKHGFNIEAALNARLRKNHLHRRISRVAMEGVGHVGKHDKEGTWRKAMWGYTKTYAAANWTYLRIELERADQSASKLN